MQRVIIIDTSILCCWLSVPNKETCGSKDDQWDYERVDNFLKEAAKEDVTFVLPLASIIETGNHIAHATRNRYDLAEKLSEIIKKTADETSPWAAFKEQNRLWSKESLKELATNWPKLAAEGMSLADTTIRDVANLYSQTGFCKVEILTGDKHLKAYQPEQPALKPRRSRK